MQLQKTGEKKVTVDVKGEISEEEREAIKDMERSIKKLEQQKKLESLEIIAPPGVNREITEENKENEEDYIAKRSATAFRNSLLTRKCKVLFRILVNFCIKTLDLRLVRLNPWMSTLGKLTKTNLKILEKII